MELLKVANFYEVLDLKEAVKEELVKRLDTENLLETLVEVDRCITEDEDVTRSNIVNFIRKNYQEDDGRRGLEGICEQPWRSGDHHHEGMSSCLLL